MQITIYLTTIKNRYLPNLDDKSSSAEEAEAEELVTAICSVSVRLSRKATRTVNYKWYKQHKPKTHVMTLSLNIKLITNYLQDSQAIIIKMAINK